MAGGSDANALGVKDVAGPQVTPLPTTSTCGGALRSAAPPYAARRKRPGFYCADAWSVLIQRDVRAVLVVVADVLLAESVKVGLVQRDHVIQHLAAYALDPSFGDAVLPRHRIPVRTAFNSLSFKKASTSPLNLLSWSNRTYR